MSNAQKLSGEEPVLLNEPQVLCCSFIEINYRLTEDCCVEVDIFNPFCTYPRIVFEQFDPVSMTYKVKKVQSGWKLRDTVISLWTLQLPLVLSMSSCPGCEIRIHYVTRDNCAGKQELQILRMEQLNPSCWSCPDDSIYSESIKFVIATNAMNFRPNIEDNCDTTWRVGMGACWTSWEYYQLRRVWNEFSHNNPGGEWVIVTDTITVMEVCDSTACCFNQITVCRTSEGINISIDSTSTAILACLSAFSRNQWGLPVFCLPVCHWLDAISGYYGFSIGKRNIDNSKLWNSNYKISSDIYNDNLNIQIYSDTRKRAIIFIYDLLGNQIYAEEIITQIGATKHTIELTTFITGLYIYTITIDDRIIKSDKFIYLK